MHCSYFFALTILLAGCAGYEEESTFIHAPQAPKHATSRPYKIKGLWYIPQQHYHLDEVGIASWYGGSDGCNGHPTATGEIFWDHLPTAAHKTLPLPCIAVVINLENNRQIIVRVNDRGPFKGKRILDVSKRTAQLLGFYAKGTAPVRIRTLVQESLALPENQRALGRISKIQRTPSKTHRVIVKHTPRYQTLDRLLAQHQPKNPTQKSPQHTITSLLSQRR